MIFRQNTRCAAIFTLMASAAMPVQHAHAQGTASEGGVPEIIVTAQKRAQSINDVGLTITALSADALETQGVQSLSDLARVVPGLSYSDTGFGTPIFTLRGVGFSDNSLSGYPTTSVYVDEVPLPFAVMTAHANLDLERLEVLKGPQGTLFGQNSTGGAINYIAAKPTSSLAAGMDASIGRFGQGEANGYVSGPITDTLGVRLAGQYGYGNGWQRSQTRDDTLGRRNYLNGRLLANWEATPGLRFQLNINGWRDRSDPLAAQHIGTSPLFEAPGGVSLVNPRYAAYAFAPDTPRVADWNTDATRPRGDRWLYQGSLRTDLDIADNITLTSITAHTKYRTDQTVDLDGTDVEAYGFNIQGKIRSFTQELRLAGGAGTSFNWVVGANYENSRTFEDHFQYYHASTVGAALGNVTAAEDATSKKRNYAFFANGEYEIVQGLTVKAGARYTNSRQTMNQCNHDTGDGTYNASVAAVYALFHPGKPFPIAIGECGTLDAQFEPSRFLDVLKEDNISWRIGMDYKPSRNLLLYVSAAKGYKAGGYPTTGALTLSSYTAVKQESLLDYEAGFKAQMFNRRVSLNGAVFNYDYRNKQLLGRYLDSIYGPLPILTNIPKSRVRGAELEVAASPVEGLQISGSMTFLDAKITDFIGVNAGGAFSDFAGSRIPFTARWQYIASVDYKAPTSGRIQPFVGATLTGRSSMTAVVGSAAGAQMLAGFRTKVPLSELYELPEYMMLDMRMGVESADGDWRFTIWGRNVTNEFSATNIIQANEAITRYAGSPATYGVTFMHKFR